MSATHLRWEAMYLGDAIERIEAGKSFGSSNRPARDGEWGIIKVSAMTYGNFRAGENKAVPPGASYSPQFEIRSGDLLISRANTHDYVGASVLVGDCPPRLLLSDKSLRLHPKPNIDARWLWYALSAPASRNYLSKASTGTKSGMRNISQQVLRDLPLVVPAIDEQRRIVEMLEGHLSRLDSATALLHAVQRRLVSMEASALSVAREGREVALAEVADIQGGIQKQPKRTPRDNAYPFLRVANVTARGLALDDVHQVELFGNELDRLRLEAGDLLVVEGNGSPSQIGRAATWDGSIANCVHQNHLIRVRPGPELLPDYLEAVWNSPETRRELTDLSSSSSGLHTLSVAKLSSLCLPVPSLEAQSVAVAVIREVRDSRRRLDIALEASGRCAGSLRRGVLSAALSGRLTGAASDIDHIEELARV